MRISFDGELYRGSRITGPTHNYLALALLSEPGRDGAFDIVPHALDGSSGERIKSEELRAWVLEGIGQANAELGMAYVPGRAEFVISDSYQPEVYVELARRIVLQAHADRASGRDR